MEYRQLGKSDLRVPVVSFGAWAVGGWMWGGTDDATAIRAIERAIDLGITCIDTAAVYGFGHSETVVGKAIAGRRNEVIIATKCGLRWDSEEGPLHFTSAFPDGTPVDIHTNSRPHSIRYEVEQSLRRLGVETIDLYQIHRPDVSTPMEEAMSTMLELQQEGKIRAIGVSNFSPEQIAECLKVAVVASEQPKYNPLERDIELSLLPFCIEHEVGLLPYSPLTQGLMTGKVTMDRTFPADDHRGDRPWFQLENRRRVLDLLEKIKPIAEGHDATLGQVAINWVISQPGITSALVGARNEKQVVENAKAVDFKLSEEELHTVRKLVEDLGKPV